jgi:hypothetical protein
MAALGVETQEDEGKGEEQPKGKRGAPEECVKACVDIKTQSCDKLKGTHLSEVSCRKDMVEQDCKDSCKF